MLLAWLRNRRRRKLLAKPFPHWWVPILERNVGHYPRLSPEEQAKLRDITRVLVAEKNWEGCGGLFVTEEMRVTIAAQAGLLLLGAPHDYYARVQSVIVYPKPFYTPVAADGWEDDELSETELGGQAVYRGPVILSWDEVLSEGRDPGCGHNLVVHEFAHQLDFLDNLVNGTPPLGDPDLEARWRYVMTVAFEDHRRALKGDEETFFSEHAGDDEAEFFADASEAFYCLPAALKEEAPGVYELLAAYYRVDPIRWFPGD